MANDYNPALTYKHNAMPAGRGNFEIYLGYRQTQNQAGNYTDIYLEMGLHALTAYAQETWNSQGATSCQINGSGASGQGYDMTGIGTGAYKKLLSTTKRINHSDNGTAAQVTLYGSCNCSGTGQGHGTITAYVTPATIPRASSIKSAGTVVPGSAYTVTINPASTSFSHTLKLLSGSTEIGTRSLAAGVTSAVFTAEETNALYSLYPNSNTANLTLQLTNSINLTSTKTVTMAINATAASPIFSNAFTFQDVNAATVAVTGNHQLLVSGISNLQVTIPAAYKATSTTGAAIIKYVISCGSKSVEVSYSNTSDVSGTINSVVSGTIQVAAVDSRGNQTIVSKLATLIPYTKPVIKSLAATRQNGVGEAVQITAEIEIYSEPIGDTTNTVTEVTYQYRATTSTGWTTGVTVITPGKNISQYVRGDTSDGFVNQNSYVIQIMVKDALGFSTRESTINSGVPVMDLYREGTAIKVGIGSRVNPDGAMLQVIGNASVSGEEVVNGSDLNNYGAAGFYYQGTNNNTTNMANIPEKLAFYLYAYNSPDSLPTQKILYPSNGHEYVRYYIGWDSSPHWSEWIPQGPPLAYITSVGNSGSFNYRKWSNGTVECWGVAWLGVIKGTTNQNGNIWYSDYATVTIPSGIFTTTPSISASISDPWAILCALEATSATSFRFKVALGYKYTPTNAFSVYMSFKLYGT